MTFKLPELGYAYDALEPIIDAETMHLHHDKHHQTYVNNANKAVEGLIGFEGMCPGQVLALLDKVPAERRPSVRNHVGGHINHTLYWKCMKKGTELKGPLKEAIIRDFGSVEALREALSKMAVSQFGSGWAWLMLSREGKLFVAQTSNQDSPIMGEKYVGFTGYPLLNIDVWEHAYYLKYKSNRADYVSAFWDIINWDYVSERFKHAGNPHFDMLLNKNKA